MNLYRDESSNPKWNAQRNLQGRTHYVDDDTLRFHKARILQTHITDNGLLFAMVESVALDPHNSKRGYRPVVFDVFGTVLERPSLENACRSRQQAAKEMWAILDSINATKHTLKAIAEQGKRMASDFKEMRRTVKSLSRAKQ